MTQGWHEEPGRWPPGQAPGQAYGQSSDQAYGQNSDQAYGQQGQHGQVYGQQGRVYGSAPAMPGPTAYGSGQPMPNPAVYGSGQPMPNPATYGSAQPMPSPDRAQPMWPQRPEPETAPEPPEPPAKRTKRRRGRSPAFWLLFVLPLLLLLGGTGYALAPLRNELPLPSVQRLLPASLRIPGTAPALPWPATGQAALEVDGIGKLGTSGGSNAVPIASVAKVMTAYIILTSHPIDPGASGPTFKITAAQAARYPQEHDRHESVVTVSAGMNYTERQALIAVLLPSANNMARILGEWDAGSQEAFVAKMNQTAADLGMASSHYTDPAGYDPGTVSTATDQVILAKKAMAIPTFAEIAKMTEAPLPGYAKPVANYNDMVGKNGVVGIKTGSTTEAGGCLMFAAQVTVGSKQVLVVGAILGQPGKDTDEQLPAVFAATEKVLQTASKSLVVHTVVKAGQTIARITGPLGSQTALNADQDVTVVGWPGLEVQVNTDVPQVPASLPASSEHGVLSVSTGQTSPTSTKLRSTVRLDQPTVLTRIKRHR